jgi:hypothetical protein
LISPCHIVPLAIMACMNWKTIFAHAAVQTE